jgi:hypothetical protein
MGGGKKYVHSFNHHNTGPQIDTSSMSSGTCGNKGTIEFLAESGKRIPIWLRWLWQASGYT